MKGLFEVLSTPLELQTGVLPTKAPDFIGLWEQWAQKGPAVFQESAGPLHGASQWLILGIRRPSGQRPAEVFNPSFLPFPGVVRRLELRFRKKIQPRQKFKF